MSDPKDQNKQAGQRDELDAALDALFSEDADAGAPASDPLAAFEEGDDPFADLAADMKQDGVSPAAAETALDADAAFDAEPSFDAAFDAEFDDAPAPRFGPPTEEADPFADLDDLTEDSPAPAETQPAEAAMADSSSAYDALVEDEPFGAVPTDDEPQPAEPAAHFQDDVPSHDAGGAFPLDAAPAEVDAVLEQADPGAAFPMDGDLESGFDEGHIPSAATQSSEAAFGDDPFAEPEPSPAFATDEGDDPFGAAAVEWSDQDAAALDAVAGGIDEAAELQAIDALEDAPPGYPGEEEPAREEAAEPLEPQPGEVRKFMFEYDFGAPPPAPAPPPVPADEVHEAEAEMVIEQEPEPEPPPPPPPPTFSEEEMAAARAVAYAEGEAAGLLRATQAHEARLTQASETISQQLPALLGERTALLNSIATEAARLSHAMVRKLVPELDRRYGVYEIESVIQSSIQKALDQPRIIVRLHSDLAQPMRERIENIALIGGFAGRVTILTDDTLGPADVRIDWGDGGSERLSGRVWQEITTIVGRVVENLEETAPPAVLDTNRPIESAA